MLVEDEAEMAKALSAALKQYDMIVDRVATLAEAEEAIIAAASTPDNALRTTMGVAHGFRWKPSPPHGALRSGS